MYLCTCYALILLKYVLFSYRCMHFLKKSDAECLFLVFNSVKLGKKCQFGYGYSHPNSGFHVPEDGIPSFPIILNFPDNLDVSDMI